MAGQRGTYAKGQVRRDQIIEGAIELFSRIGYRNASILDIATHVGISRTGLLHHFPSKEALLKAILAKRDREDIERFGRSEEPLNDLQNLVELVRHNASIPELVGLFAVLSAEAADPAHPAHDYFIERYDRARAAIRTALGHASDAQLLKRGVDIEHESRALVALLDGLQIQWLLAPTEVDMARELSVELQGLLLVPLDPY